MASKKKQRHAGVCGNEVDQRSELHSRSPGAIMWHIDVLQSRGGRIRTTMKPSNEAKPVLLGVYRGILQAATERGDKEKKQTNIFRGTR